MTQTRRKFSAQEKVALLRRHLVEKVPVSDLCDECHLAPNVFYRWQKEFFENGAAAFARDNGCEVRHLQDENEALRTKVAHKDEVIAEIIESNIAPKKLLAGAERRLQCCQSSEAVRGPCAPCAR